MLTSACQGPWGLQLLPSSRLTRVSSEQFAVTGVTIYAVERPVDLNMLFGYPLDFLPEDHWHLRLWNDSATANEVKSLIEWLTEQRRMWSDSAEGAGYVRRIDEIITDLSSWHDPATNHKSRIAYSYSNIRKPGIAGFDTYSWLNFYYLNPDGTAITSITNAFR